MANGQKLAPSLGVARLKWWKPLGLIVLLLRILWRYWITGQYIFSAGDNATFLHDATVDHRGGPREKLTRARWRRIARRWVILGIPLILGAVALFSETARWVLLTYTSIGLLGGFMYGVNTFSSWAAVNEYRKTYIYPATQVLSRATGVPLKRSEALNTIVLPEGFGDGPVEDPVRVYLPEVALDPKMKKRIVDTVGARLGLPDAQAVWTEAGVPRRFVELLPMPLPKKVTLEEIMDFLTATDLDHPIVGMEKSGQPVYMDFRNDSPHTLGSAGSGAGKSTLYKFIGMQRMRHGAYAIILDFKKWSHLRWAGRITDGRVRIEDGVPEIHDLLCKVLDELLWRKSFSLDQEDELNALPRIDVYIEEMNTLMEILVTYWMEISARQKQQARTRLRRAKEHAKTVGEDAGYYDAEIEEAEEELAAAMGLPKTSPAIQAFRFGVNLGREFGIHFHVIGQSLSAQAIGGRNTRASFKTRMLAKWDAKDWKMLADGIPYVACPDGERGIWAHVHGSSFEIVRVPMVEDKDAVQFVLSGVRPSLPMFHGDPRPTIEGQTTQPAIAPAAPLSEIVKILPARADGTPVTLSALRTAAKRPGFPDRQNEPGPGEAALYVPEEVEAWLRSRT